MKPERKRETLEKGSEKHTERVKERKGGRGGERSRRKGDF